MRVALDTNALYTTRAGMARHIRGLKRGFQSITPPDSAECRLFDLCWPVENLSYRQPARALKTFYRELVWARYLAPRILRRRQADLLHAAAGIFILPPAGIRHVVTVHDLAVLHQRRRFRLWHRYSWKRRLRFLPRADRIICISRSTADECMQQLELPAHKLRVVYNGCDFHPDESSPVETPPPVPPPSEFFLFVGSLEPGKNLGLLRQAYEIAASQGRSLPPLVIVGARWEGVAREGKPPADWHYLGRIPDENLVYLYRRALALVFPSAYEGFGLPVAEAMALGCPVICSRVTSLPEVGGNAACYVELTPPAYLDAMRRLEQNPDTREEQARLGLEQARRFSWQRCAIETREVYREALAT